jgi:hypothetical protein
MQFVAGNVDIERTDIALLAAQAVRSAVADGISNKAKLEAGLNRIDQTAKRFKWEAKEGADLVSQVLDGRRRQLLLQIDKCDHAIRVQSKALKVLEGYSYQVEEPPAVAGLNFNELTKMFEHSSQFGRPGS